MRGGEEVGFKDCTKGGGEMFAAVNVLDLPQEVTGNVMRRMGFESVRRCSATCRQWREAIREDEVRCEMNGDVR